MEQKNQTANYGFQSTGDATQLQNSSGSGGGTQSNFPAGMSYTNLPNPFNSSYTQPPPIQYPRPPPPPYIGNPSGTHSNFNSSCPPNFPVGFHPLNSSYTPSRFNFDYNPTGPAQHPFGDFRESISNFSDDEPLPVGTPATTTLPNSRLEKVAIKTCTEFPSIVASDTTSSFAVLMGIHAPPLPVVGENQRVPIDLVAVLDVSGSMCGDKLSLLKSATNFVIDHMLPCDRLSIVSFQSHASRVFPLRRMTDMGRNDAKFAVEHLLGGGGTNIAAGLNMGAQILEQRRERNPVTSIIFVSDGQDTYGFRPLSSSISRVTSETDARREERLIPVHTFGVGMDHDPVVLNAIADGSDGTYSFVESAEMIPRSFARCIGGLFSVVAQDVRIVVWSASPGVEIKSIPSGRHRHEIISQQKQGIIHVGELYAEEKKEFLVYLSVPANSNNQMVIGDETTGKTPLLDIACYYRNAFTDEIVQIEGTRIEIPRPTNLSSADLVVNLEVDRQRNRVTVGEKIAKAKEMADIGDFNGARDLLSSTRKTLLASASAQSGDEMANWLDAELREISARMENSPVYNKCGRGFVLAGMSAAGAQRGASRNHTFLQGMAMASSGACFGAGAAPMGAMASSGACFGAGAPPMEAMASSGALFGGGAPSWTAPSYAMASSGDSFGAGAAPSFAAAAGNAYAAAYDTPAIAKMLQKVDKKP